MPKAAVEHIVALKARISLCAKRDSEYLVSPDVPFKSLSPAAPTVSLVLQISPDWFVRTKFGRACVACLKKRGREIT